MGILREQKTAAKLLQNCCKTAARIFTKQMVVFTGLGLSKDILCILVIQGSAKLQQFKFEGLKKILMHVKRQVFFDKDLLTVMFKEFMF